MAQFTYNERMKFVDALDRLMGRNKTFADALRVVSDKQDVSVGTLRKYYNDKKKIKKAVDNGWGKEVYLTDEKLRTKNTAVVRKKIASNTQFHQNETERMIRVRKCGDYLEADIIERSKNTSYSHKASAKQAATAYQQVGYGNQGFQNTATCYIASEDSSDSY